MKNKLAIFISCLSAFAASAGLAAHSTLQQHAAASNKARTVIVGHASAAFPDATLTDVVSYADQVSVVTVESERQGQIHEETLANREGYVPRKLSARIEKTLWVAEGVTATEGEIEMGSLGWHLKGDTLVELASQNSPRLVVGGQYTIALTKVGDRKYGALNGRVAIPVPGNAAAEQDAADRGVSELVQSLRGKSEAELVQALSEAARDPLVEQFRNLPPGERIKAVLDAQAAGGRP